MHSSTVLPADGNTGPGGQTAYSKGHDHSSITKRTRFDGCGPLVALSFIAETARVTDAEHYRGSITHASLQIHGVELDHNLIHRVDLPS